VENRAERKRQAQLEAGHAPTAATTSYTTGDSR